MNVPPASLAECRMPIGAFPLRTMRSVENKNSPRKGGPELDNRLSKTGKSGKEKQRQTEKRTAVPFWSNAEGKAIAVNVAVLRDFDGSNFAIPVRHAKP